MLFRKVAGDGAIIPVRLQRFLETTTRRDGIWNTKVAAVIVKDRMFAVDQNNALPSRWVEDWDIARALGDMLRELGVDANAAAYLGSVDYVTPKGRTRQYNFLVRPVSARDMSYVCMEKLANADEKKTAELIFRKERVLA